MALVLLVVLETALAAALARIRQIAIILHIGEKIQEWKWRKDLVGGTKYRYCGRCDRGQKDEGRRTEDEDERRGLEGDGRDVLTVYSEKQVYSDVYSRGNEKKRKLYRTLGPF